MVRSENIPTQTESFAPEDSIKFWIQEIALLGYLVTCLFSLRRNLIASLFQNKLFENNILLEW